MISLTLSRREPALPGATAKEAHPSGDGIRDLLRDTALFVTSLAPGGEPKSVDEVQEQCRKLARDFSDALHRRGYADEVCNDAEMAQCGLLDEIALRCFKGATRSAWELQPLQVERFGIHDAGERVFERLEQRLREPTAQVDLLECYSAVLGMGFVGRYAREGEAKLDALVSALHARIAKLRPAAAQPFTSDHTARRAFDWLHRLSPWATAGLLAIVAVLVWLVWHGALDVQLAHLLSGKPQS
ncbi:DotU family type IV/VI secretion system protein [Paraburkholderia silviterrae]|uniref:DotU family type IV/VI secretion system protein n=1 Tax=Paraburkholderia silviterrae TaxID=2528715 RepID=A0A4R5M3T8_9BURK|nr:DotU family type IV/VI secretion system protein [Paraburkholderia silviterrae]TDG20345.1 DotU family type IV/VI secretion system protein [Paraburkholderia silviterrae]